MKHTVIRPGVRISFVLAGTVIAGFVVLSSITHVPYRLLVVVPIFLATAAGGLCVGARLESRITRGGIAGCGVGLLSMGVGAWLLIAPGEKPFIAFMVIAPPAVGGYAIYTISIVYTFSRSEHIEVPSWALASLAVLPVVDPLFNAIVTPILSVGIALTGVSWGLLGMSVRFEARTETEQVPESPP